MSPGGARHAGADPQTATRLERYRLMQRAMARYELLTERATVGPLRFSFTRIADPNRVLDMVADEVDRDERRGHRREGAELHLPYWAELWDSSWAIAEALVARPLAGLRVMDLGCGQGLVGTAAAMAGAAEVLFADIETPALLLARLNSVAVRDRATARRVNWQTDRLGRRFDIIAGADILYERSQWTYLVPFWKTHLAPGGTILLGEPGRQTGDLFLPWIKTQGFTVDLKQVSVPTRKQPVRVIELRE